MANLEQCTKLREGPATWNMWRATQPADIAIDLTEADLHGADLSHAKFVGANLIETHLQESDLRYADMSKALPGFTVAQLAGADITGTQLPETIEKSINDLEFGPDHIDAQHIGT